MPTIDLQPLIDQIRASLLTAQVTAIPQAKNLALGYLAATEARVATIAAAYAAGEITTDDLGESLKNELVILENQLLSEAVLLSQLSEDLINSIISQAKDFVTNLINTL